MALFRASVLALFVVSVLLITAFDGLEAKTVQDVTSKHLPMNRNRFLLRTKTNLGKNFKSKFADNCAQFSYFSNKVDHFNFDPKSDLTYQQRYIISDANWKGNNGPIFFYTGNEGDIQWFCENTGFIWDIAPNFSALVVFAEHRYYGTSLPFGNKSFDYPHINYLTTEQALADFAYLISSLKANYPGASKSPVIAFGGSYGGMLTAWFRFKYSNMVVGGIAASAPIWQVTADCDSFSLITTDAFAKADPKCPLLVNASWSAFNSFDNAAGRAQLTKVFKLCKPLDSVDNLKAWLSDAYGNIAMANYPYPANFLNPLPAWPVKAMCESMINSFQEAEFSTPLSLVTAIYHGMNLFANYTGDVKCFDLDSDVPADINMISWTYQTCTEFVFPTCSNGISDMFEPQAWSYDDYKKQCKDQFGVEPRMEWPNVNFGGNAQEIKYHTNIVFSNGALDPWYGGGVLVDVNPKVQHFLIQDGAHHLDLRESNINDPKSVIQARLVEQNAIQNWIDEWNASL